jgi:hypothetical protein
MTSFTRWLLALASVVGVLPAVADAHFVLVEPSATLVQDQRGDPQKLGPCGGTSADAGTPSNIVGKVQGGQKLHLKLMETVYHPGHYRVALAVNSLDELPADPKAVTRESDTGPRSVSAPIQNPPQTPVLADGLFVHTAKSADPFETDIQLPNITCPKCTLQVVEFMAEHGVNKDGEFYYHHCANLAITADPAKPIDKRFPAVQNSDSLLEHEDTETRRFVFLKTNPPSCLGGSV